LKIKRIDEPFAKQRSATLENAWLVLFSFWLLTSGFWLLDVDAVNPPA
jgi:hypothetical protein